MIHQRAIESVATAKVKAAIDQATAPGADRKFPGFDVTEYKPT
jgi:hypothetical protein